MPISSSKWDSGLGVGPSGNQIVDQVTGYDRAYSASVAPQARNPYTEGQAMLAAQTGTAQGQYDAYAQYMPQYAATNSAAASQQMGASVDMYGQYNPYINDLNNASNTAYRTGTINDVSQYGQTVADQYRSLNPELYASLNAMSTAAGQSGGASELETMLGQQAQEQLALGSSLTSAEQRSATQAARSAGAARGLYDSNTTIGAEILNNYSLGQQRQQQRQQFASDTATLLRSGQAQDFSNLSAATNAWSANSYDPYAGILGQQSSNQLSSYNVAGLNQQGNSYNQQAVYNQFDPYNSYANSIYGSAYQAEANAQLNQANLYGQAAQGRSSIGGLIFGNIFG